MIEQSPLYEHSKVRRANIDLSWLYPALGGQLGAQANPGFGTTIDDSGNIVDPKGNVLASPDDPNYDKLFNSHPDQPDKSPSWWQKIGDPEGSRTAIAANTAAENQAGYAQQTHDIAQGLGARDYTTALTGYGKQPDQISPAAGAVLTDNNPNFTNLHGVSSTGADEQYHNPQTDAQKTAGANRAAISSQLAFINSGGPFNEGYGQAMGMQNEANRQVFDRNAGVPFYDEANRLSFDKLGMSRNANDITMEGGRSLNMPSYLTTQANEANANEIASGGKLAAAPAEAATAFNQALINKGLTQAEFEHSSEEEQTKIIDIANGYMQATHRPPMTNTVMIGADGKLHRNPLGMNPQQQGMASMMSGGIPTVAPAPSSGASGARPFSNGTGVILPGQGAPVPPEAAPTVARPLSVPSSLGQQTNSVPPEAVVPSSSRYDYRQDQQTGRKAIANYLQKVLHPTYTRDNGQ